MNINKVAISAIICTSLVTLSILSLLLGPVAASAKSGGTTITIGQTTVLSSTDSGNGNLLLVQEATLSQTATIQSISFYVLSAAGQLRLGIYDATGPGGGPGTLLAQSNSFTPVSGWNTQNVVTPVSLPAGNYWLAYFPSSSSLTFAANFSIGQFKYANLTFGSMPSTFPAVNGSGATNWSLYASLNAASTPAPTATLSASPTSITSGQSSTLSWSSTNATSCTGSGFSPSGISGSASVSPTVTSNYSVTCTGPGGTSAPATASITVSYPVTIGQTTVLSSTDSGNGNLLLVQEATLSQTATIQSISFYVLSAAGQLRLGIYDATGPGGGPGTLLAQSNSFTPVSGWNTQNVVTPVSLPAGNYWLAYFPSSSSLTFAANFSIGQFKYANLTFGSMPSTFPAVNGSGATNWSLYASLNAASTPAPTATLSASPTSITSGQSSTLSWSSTNATSCTGSGFSPSGISGSASVSPTVTNNYSVTCTGPGGTSAPATASITVTAAPVNGLCGSANGTTTSSAPTTNLCSAGNASSVSGNGPWTWSCAGTNGGSTAQCSASLALLPTATLSASPTSITSGQSSTLSWSSTNATSCNASGGWTGSKATSGTQSVSPTVNTTYSLACIGSGGTSPAASAMVTVSNPTTPPSITVVAPTGQLPAGTTQTTLSVTTNENATCGYSTVAGVAFASMTAFSTTGGLSDSTTLTGLTGGSSYTYYVKCKDTFGNISADSAVPFSVAASVDTTPPSVPTSLSASAVSSSQINLTWTASTDNVGVMGYNIYRGGTQIATSATNSYADSGLTASTQYTYTVSAYDAAGNNSAQSSAASATTQAASSGSDPTVGLLPSDRDAYANWKMAGLQSVGGIPNRTTICATVSPLGGGQDDAAQIQNAVNNCPSGEVVQLTAGTFTINAPHLVTIDKSITVRGSGPCAGATGVSSTIPYP